MEVIENINRGGFGIVDKVRLDDGTVVARKTFDPSVPIKSGADREKLLKRFQREVKFQSSIDSEAICPILDSDLSGENPWFTMPLADKNFAEEIVECLANSSIPSEALADVLNALEKLHELGFVHRDLKPENVLLVDGIWSLSDFGLILPPTGTTTQLTSVGSAWGTINYAAPEQSSEFHSVGPGADIYAFGCILHDIFGASVRIPYARHSAQGAIGAIIERCTEVRPDRRFVSIPAVRGAVLSILSSPPALTPSTTATDWVDSIENNQIVNQEQFEELNRFIRLEAADDDRYAIFKALDDGSLRHLFDVSEAYWKLLVGDFCEWVSSESNFDFAYCDVLVQRLQAVFVLGDIEMKAAAMLAAAELGYSHNRWHVMERLVNSCGPSLDDSVAQRICIDIRAFAFEGRFRRCADGLGRNYDAYHPLIKYTIEND